MNKLKNFVKKNGILKNTLMLYGLSAVKLLLPLLTLPYLTRVLSVETYGLVSYTKAIMSYMQTIVDFGFMLSGTKDIVKAKGSKDQLAHETIAILEARLFIVIVCAVILVICCYTMPLLRNNVPFALLSFVPVALSVFLFDYLFRGIEKMEIITLRFLTMKGISTILTLLLVKKDENVLLIPLLDILGTLVAVVLVLREIKKYRFKIMLCPLKEVCSKLIESALYFVSNMATTAFGALNTVIIGMFLSANEVAYWSVCMQLINAVQALYTPITDGVYPEMVKEKNLLTIKKILRLFTPVVLLGCMFSFAVAPHILRVIGGIEYTNAAPTFRALIPVLLFSFPSILLGWPTLGAIGKVRQVTITTILSACFQIIGLLILWMVNRFTLMSIAILRSCTEFAFMLLRLYYCILYRNEFSNK